MNIFAAPIATAQRLTLFWISEVGGKEVRHKFKVCIYNNVHQIYASFTLSGPNPALTSFQALREATRRKLARETLCFWGRRGGFYISSHPFNNTSTFAFL